MAQQWAKVAANLDSHPKIRRAGRNGREVFLFILRRVADLDAMGSVHASNVSIWYLCDVLQMPEADAVDGLKRAIDAGLVTMSDDHVHVTGWDDEWAKRPLTEAERQAKRRAKTKDVTNSHGDSVTERDTSRDVTTSHEANVTCPDSHALDKSREDKTRAEETRGEEQPRKRVAIRLVAGLLTSAWEPRPEEQTLAVKLGVDCASEADKIRDWSAANGARKVDWNAAFRNWLKRAAEDRAKGRGSSKPQDPRFGRVEPDANRIYPDGEVTL